MYLVEIQFDPSREVHPEQASNHRQGESSMKVLVDRSHKPVLVVQINRPEVRNCVDGETAKLLHDAFVDFAEDDEFTVAILKGSGGHFCAGADLRAISEDKAARGGANLGSKSSSESLTANPMSSDMDEPGPMGPTRLSLPKPVIACVDGYAVAGGLELAAWADLRVASKSARLGVLCRTKGVPLIDGGTVRLPQLIGQSRTQDLILTGRLIDANEGERMGLLNMVIDSTSPDEVFQEALSLAKTLAAHPQQCMRGDRLSVKSLPVDHGAKEGERATGKWNVQGEERRSMELEFQHGLRSLQDLGQALEDFVHRKRDGARL